MAYHEPPEQARARAKRWYNAHADLVIARSRAWKLAHVQKTREYGRLYARRRAVVKICATDGCKSVVPTLEGQLKFCKPCGDFYRKHDTKRRTA